MTFDEALDAIAREHPISSSQVRASALRRKVWIARRQFVGCLPDWFEVSATKHDAIESAATVHDDAPRGLRAALKRGDVFALNEPGAEYVLVERVALSDLF
jgi:hypothetical protein